jgi:hypothetical protein
VTSKKEKILEGFCQVGNYVYINWFSCDAFDSQNFMIILLEISMFFCVDSLVIDKSFPCGFFDRNTDISSVEGIHFPFICSLLKFKRVCGFRFKQYGYTIVS